MNRRRPVTFDDGLELRLADGATLNASVWRPAKPGRYPVILLRTPYDGRHGEDYVYAHPSWYASYGFAVVTQDVRGRTQSGGEFDPFAHEADDGRQAIEWAAELPFSNGSVGMNGMSYPATVQYFAAAARPEPLRAIAPMLGTISGFEGWTYNSGAFALAFNLSWATFLAHDVARRRGDSSAELEFIQQYAASASRCNHLPLDSVPGLEKHAPYFYEWLKHDTYDDYWIQRSAGALDHGRVASFCVGGLYDVFLEGTIAAHTALRSSASRFGAHLTLTPWWHSPLGRYVGGLDFGSEAGSGWFNRRLVEFFGTHLRDDDPGSEPAVRAFVTGANRWETLDVWPPPAAETRLYLHAKEGANSMYGDGALLEELPDEQFPDRFTYDPAFPIPSMGGRSCCFPQLAPMGPADQRPLQALNFVLVYVSEPLQQDTFVAGEASVSLFASTTAPDTDWTSTLCDIAPDGTAINVQEGIQRARFATGEEKPIPAGEISEFRIRLGTVCHVFKTGHRIGLNVSSSNFPHWDRNMNTGHRSGHDGIGDRVVATQTVFHDRHHPSALVLPVVSS